MLAFITVVFTWQQESRQLQIENQRAEAERELAEQRAQDEALQAYLDQMSSLLLEKDLRTSEEDSEVRTLARARTATVIQRLDSNSNRNVIRFLTEAGLMWREQSSIRLLAEADLQGAHLEGTNLGWADLSGADLKNANLSDGYLFDANLRGANLRGADLSSANLSSANLRGATALSDEKIAAAGSLEGATMPDGQKYEEWLKRRGEDNSGSQ